MRHRILLLVVVLFGAIFVVIPLCAGEEPPGADATVAAARPLSLDDPVEPLAPRDERSEAEQDRLRAMSLYGAGRMKEQQDDLPAALRYYQRAFRHDPAAHTIARDAVAAALHLGRSGEAMRYAVKAATLDTSDRNLAKRLAEMLTQQQDLAGASALYKQLVAEMQEDGQPTDYLLLWSLGRVYFLDGTLKEAVPALESVANAVAEPEKHKLDSKERQQIVDEAARFFEILVNNGDGGKRKREALAYEFFGEAFLGGEAAEQAEQAFGRAQDVDADAARRAFNEARVLKLKGDAPGSLAELEKYLEDPASVGDDDAYELLAELHEQLDDRDALLPRLEKLRESRGDDPALAAALAREFRRTEQFDKSAALYEELLTQARDGQRRPPVEAYRALVDIRRRQSDEARLLDAVAEALAILPAVEILGDEGKALVADADAIARLAETARKRGKPGEGLSFDAAQAMALVALEAKQYELAEEFFNAALEAKPDASAKLLQTWGLGLLVAEQFADAAKVFRRALDEQLVGDEAAEFEYHLAGALEMDGQTDEALAAAKRAAALAEQKREQLEGSYYRMLTREPWILYHAKRYAEAEAAYRAFVERFDGSYDDEGLREQLRETRLMLSNLAVLEEKMPEAEEWLEQVLDEFPDDTSAHNDLGYLWAEQGKRLQRSLRMIQKAVADDPDNAAYRDSLGWAYFQLGRFEEARAELEKAADEEKPDGVILDHLGDVYWKLGEHEQARGTWMRAIERFREDEDVKHERITTEKLDSEPGDDATGTTE